MGNEVGINGPFGNAMDWDAGDAANDGEFWEPRRLVYRYPKSGLVCLRLWAKDSVANHHGIFRRGRLFYGPK